MHVHVIIVGLAMSCQNTDKIFLSQPLHIDEWQQEILLVDREGHVEPFRADRSDLLVLVVQSIEPFLEVQELQARVEGT